MALCRGLALAVLLLFALQAGAAEIEVKHAEISPGEEIGRAHV